MNIELAQKLIKTKIKLLMHIRGMNKSEIAEQLHGWSRPAVDHWLKSPKTNIPNEALVQIAKILDVPVSFFYCEYEREDFTIEAAGSIYGDIDDDEFLYLEAMADYVRLKKGSKVGD